jgi:hypothetical protein
MGQGGWVAANAGWGEAVDIGVVCTSSPADEHSTDQEANYQRRAYSDPDQN